MKLWLVLHQTALKPSPQIQKGWRPDPPENNYGITGQEKLLPQGDGGCVRNQSLIPSFTITKDYKNMQLFIFQMVKPVNFQHVCFKKSFTVNQ